jgi:hypothetical protein
MLFTAAAWTICQNIATHPIHSIFAHIEWHKLMIILMVSALLDLTSNEDHKGTECH